MKHYLDNFYYDPTTRSLYKLLSHHIYANDKFYKRKVANPSSGLHRLHVNGKRKDMNLQWAEKDPSFKDKDTFINNILIRNNRVYQEDPNHLYYYIDNKCYRLIHPNPARKAYQLYIRGHYVWVPITTLFPPTPTEE